MNERKFYDIHYHLFDLSHANLLAFLLRDDLINKGLIKRMLNKIPILIKIVPNGLMGLFPARIARKIREFLQNDSRNLRNLLSVMESAVEYHFLYIEYFLLNEHRFFGKTEANRYSKIVICPQLIDFGYKNLNNNDCFYNVPPSKPVVNQAVDVINAIWFYYNCEIIPHPDRAGRLKVIPCSIPKEDKLFEIYPFLGINTKNYDLFEMVEMFDKYFSGYEDDTPSIRRKKLYDRLGSVKVDTEDMVFRRKEKTGSSYYTYLFAGIKLYPPLGFDPWPEEDQNELDKVRFLYSECIRRRLPVIVHCSDGGFRTTGDSNLFTDPSLRWKKVLTRPELRDLKINFAHLGNRKGGEQDWLQAILEYIRKNKNVYSDCACITPQMKDYEMIRNIMNEDVESKILFGSDFMINLIWSDSYNEYLRNFLLTPFLDDRQRSLMCETNPEKFLFG